VSRSCVNQFVKKQRYWYGVLFVLMGIVLCSLGGMCLNGDLGDGEIPCANHTRHTGPHSSVTVATCASCEHRSGVIMTCVGASALFVGLMFLSCRSVSTALSVFWRFAKTTFVFGVVVASVGGACMNDDLAGVDRDQGPGCDWLDGVVMFIVGWSLVGLSIVPSVVVWLDINYPDVARTKPFILGAVAWGAGVVVNRTQPCIPRTKPVRLHPSTW